MDKPVITSEGFVERREEPRLEVAVAARIDQDPDGRVAITQDLSLHGARMLCIDRLQAGEAVEVWFLTPSENEEVRVSGRVVRAEPFSVSGPWRCRMAVRFDQPLDGNLDRFVGKA